MDIDPDSPVPVYRQLAADLRSRIARGEFAPGRPIPSEVTLRQSYGVGRDTVRHAVEVLREEGIVFTVAHKGTYVTQPELGG